MQVYLATDRLILRQFTMDDVDHLVELDRDPEVMRYLTGRPTPRETIERDLLPWWLADYERGDWYGFWAAIEQQTGDFIGWFHLRPGPDAPHDAPELGYRLRRQAWGKGYATEGARALVRKGFTEYDIRRVTVTTFQDNRGSRRVLEKAGLRMVRAFRLTPEMKAYHGMPANWDGDVVEYVIERDEWATDERATQA
jgi:RimJ/RimL family protein N-acetyltransferase